MSDDLVKQLRDDSGDWLTDLAADRIEALEARVAAADKLAEAVDNHSNMVCQDFGLQLELGRKVDEALAAYQATKEGE
jgi:hypothetical protein